MSTVSKDQAAAIVAAIDLVIPPPPVADVSGSAALSTETVSDPLRKALTLIKWFDKNWDAISIEVEDAATFALVRLGIGLEHAQDDAERDAASQAFLREITSVAPAYEQLANSPIYLSPGRTTTQTTHKGSLPPCANIRSLGRRCSKARASGRETWSCS